MMAPGQRVSGEGGRSGAASKTSVVDRVVDLLTHVVEGDGAVSLGEVSEGTGLPKPTAYRILQALVARDVLLQDDSRQYVVGPKFLSLAGQALQRGQLTSNLVGARPVLESLRSVTPETVHLAALVGDELIYVDKLEGERSYKMASTIGMTLDLHSSGIGKAVLAYMDPERRKGLLTPGALVRRTSNTFTDVSALEAELDVVLRRGFAIDDEENEADIRCVAAPIFDARGEVTGGISVTAPAFDLSLRDAMRLGPEVVEAGRALSRAIGGADS